MQSQLEDMRHKVGSSLSERYTSSQKGTAKIMSDYEKQRKELIRVRYALWNIQLGHL